MSGVFANFFLICKTLHITGYWLLIEPYLINADPTARLSRDQVDRGTNHSVLGGIHTLASREGDVHREPCHHYHRSLHPIALEITNATSDDMIIQRSWGS